MKDHATVEQFIALRAQDHPYTQIAATLKVGKRTLIRWSRLYHCEIQNLRAVESEALVARCLASRPQRLQSLGDTLGRVEAELAKRDLTDVSTARLLELASRLRSEAARESGAFPFVESARILPVPEAARLAAPLLHWQG